MKVCKLSELKKTLGHLLNDESNQSFPKEITFSRGIEFSKYRITIDQIEEDFFVDSKGQTWAKVKNDDYEESNFISNGSTK